jgi:hypothetical protein
MLKLSKSFHRQREIKEVGDIIIVQSSSERNGWFFAKEISSGYVSFSGGPVQQSSQSMHDKPSPASTEAKPLYLSNNFKMFLHQKDPFLV